jgi:hypothetical protein
MIPSSMCGDLIIVAHFTQARTTTYLTRASFDPNQKQERSLKFCVLGHLQAATTARLSVRQNAEANSLPPSAAAKSGKMLKITG